MNNTSVLSVAKNRVVWLDVVRFVAMFTVVCCHCADPFNFYSGEPSAELEQIKFWGAAYGAFLRPCVPLFVMITGALLLPVRGETSVFYKKRISRVFWPFLLWSVLYNLFPWITGLLGFKPEVILDFFPYSGEEATRQALSVSLKNIAEIPLNFSLLDVHMWYIYLLIGLYLYLPIFSAWVEKASEKAQLWFLAAWGITTLLPYYYEYVSPYLWGSCSWNSFGMLYYFAGFNGYLLLGHYLGKRTDWSLGKTFSVTVPLFLVGYFITLAGFRYMTSDPNVSEEGMELFFTYCSPNALLMTAAVFLLVRKVRITSPVICRALANLTKCGFGLYCVHYFFVGPSYMFAQWIGTPIPALVPVSTILTFICSWSFTYLVSKLPHAKYIIG